ncbi:MAG: hypothetical protein V4516_04860 [Pseudomonadota bacterium]
MERLSIGAAILLTVVLSLFLAHPGRAVTEKVFVAEGCFWCGEADFEKVRGAGMMRPG